MVCCASLTTPCTLVLLVLSVTWGASVNSAVLLQDFEEDTDNTEMKYCGYDPTLLISECYKVQKDGSLSTKIDPLLEDSPILPESTLCKSAQDTDDGFLICVGGQWTSTDLLTGQREKRWGSRRQNRPTAYRCSSEYQTISNGRTNCIPANQPTLCCYYCDTGYELVGRQTISCRNNVWRAPKPVCQVRTAPPERVTCAAGSYLTGNGTCELCAIGYYQEKAAMTSCMQCPDGKTTDVTGATSISQCHENVGVIPV